MTCCYKAIEKYYNAEGKQIEHLCGFGYCKNLEEARKTYRAGIHIYEISEAELEELRDEHRQDIEEDDYWEVYNCLCRAMTVIIDTHESMRPRHNYHAILNRAELSIAALLDELRGDNEEEEEE